MVLGGILDRDVTHATPRVRMAHPVQSLWCVSLVIGWNTYSSVFQLPSVIAILLLYYFAVYLAPVVQYIVGVFEYFDLLPYYFLIYSI